MGPAHPKRDLRMDRMRIKSLAAFAADDFTDIPKMRNSTLCCGFLLIAGIFHIDGMGTAVSAFHLNAPTALMHDQSRTPTNGALFQKQFFHIGLLI